MAEGRSEAAASGEQQQVGWVVVRTTISTGRRWYQAKPGRYESQDPAWAQVYEDRAMAGRVATGLRRDLGWRAGSHLVAVEPVAAASPSGEADR